MSNRSNGWIKNDPADNHHGKRYIMLNCFVLGNGASFTFDIKDEKNSDVVTFSHFREKLVQNKRKIFREAEAEDLKLWRVNIHTRRNKEYEELKENPHLDIDIGKKFGGEVLDASWSIIKEFSNPPEEHVHIIVQPPSPPATTGLKRPISEPDSQNSRPIKIVKTEGPVDTVVNFCVPFDKLDSTRELEESISQHVCVLFVGHFQSGKTSTLHFLSNNRTNHFYVHSETIVKNGFLHGICKNLSLDLCDNTADFNEEILKKYKEGQIVILVDEFDLFYHSDKYQNTVDQLTSLCKCVNDKGIKGVKSIVFTGSYLITKLKKDGITIRTSQEDELLVIPSPLNSAKIIHASDFNREQHMSFFEDIQVNKNIKLSKEVLDDVFSVTNGYAGLEGLLASLCMEYAINEFQELKFNKWNARFTNFRRYYSDQKITAVNSIEKYLEPKDGTTSRNKDINGVKKLLERFLQNGTLQKSEIDEEDSRAIIYLRAYGIINDHGDYGEKYGFTSNIILDMLSSTYYPFYNGVGLATISSISSPLDFLDKTLDLLRYIHKDVIFHPLVANQHSFSEAIIQGELYALLRMALTRPYRVFRETRTLEKSEKKCDLWVCNAKEYGIECKVDYVSDKEITNATKQAIGYTRGREKVCCMFLLNFVPSDSKANDYQFFFPEVKSPRDEIYSILKQFIYYILKHLKKQKSVVMVCRFRKFLLYQVN